MEYRLKALINGAELLDEQSDTTSSITGVKITQTCGKGFEIGSTASSSLTLTILKPYKDSFDGDQIDIFLKTTASDNEESTIQNIADEVGDSTETEVVIPNSTYDDITTSENEEEGEEMTEAEIEAYEAEQLLKIQNLYKLMYGEDVEDTSEYTSEEAELPEWECIGSFYVYSQSNNSDGSITLQCYDGFSLMSGAYTPTIDSGTFQEYYDDIRNQLTNLGIVVDADDYTTEYNPTIKWNQTCSYREAIGYLAGLQGGFATFGDDNTLGISYYGYDDHIIIESDAASITWTSAGQTEIDSIECQTDLLGTKLTAGEGQAVSYYNPLMTSEALAKALDLYEGINYYGAELQAIWNPDLLTGEIARVMTEAEYANYLALQNSMNDTSAMTEAEINDLKKQLVEVGKSILVSSQTISFAGGTATCIIKSELTTESEKNNTPTAPSDQKISAIAEYAKLLIEQIDLEASFDSFYQQTTAGVYFGADETTGALIIKSKDSEGKDADTSIEISNNQITFKVQDKPMAYINGTALVIPYSFILNEMMVGRDSENQDKALWSWATRTNKHLQLKWIGGTN